MFRNLRSGILTIFVVVILASASTTLASSIPIRGTSTYGLGNAQGSGSSSGTFGGGSFIENTLCSFPDINGSICSAYSYDFSITLTPPVGATKLTLDFPTAPPNSLALVFCDLANAIPCGTLSGDPISGTLGPDSGAGQMIVFTDLSQLKGQTMALVFTDNFSSSDAGDAILVPQFSAVYGASSVPTAEPGCLALLGLGLLAFGGKLRRRTS